MRNVLDRLRCHDFIEIRRVKNRWNKPAPGGWADIMINVSFKDAAPGAGQVMEIQVIHEKMMMIRKSPAFGGHTSYNLTRAVLEIFETLELPSPDEELSLDVE